MRTDSPGRDHPTSRVGGGPLGALPRLSSSARRALAGCAVLAALAAVATVGQAWALASVLADLVAGRGGPFGPRLALLAGAVAARAVLGWATQVVASRAAAGAKEELRALLLDRALALGPEWIAARGPAELTTLATKGLDALDAYFTVYLPAVLSAVIVPVGIGGVILLADWPSAVVIALTVPLIPVFAALVGLRTRDRVRVAGTTMERLAGHLLELLRALPVLTAFRRAEAQATAVRRVSDAHRRASLSTLRLAFASALVLELIATLSVAVVAVLIGVRLVAGDLGLAVGLFVLILAPECYLPLRAAGAAHHASEDGLEAVRRVAEVPEGVLQVARSPEGRLRVEALRVRRREGFAPDGMSFTVRPGEMVRLDGPSGSGKSTAFGALLGFVQPDSGTIDGLPPLEDIAWVPQRPAFTGGTAAEEIALAVLEPPTRTELETVAAQAVAEHLLDRPVDELSTGERQRVAIARAMLRVRRGARLLLLDEPTAHLDPDTAARVMSTVHALLDDGVAVVLASHRVTDSSPTEPDQPAVLPALSTVVSSPPARLRSLITPRLLLGAALGAGALVAGIALTATSAWLIAKASQQPPILTLSVAVVGVRTFGLARAGLRYVERLVTHDAAFRSAADLRVRLWSALVRMGPARTISLRRTDGLQRLVGDVDTVRDLTPRVLLPPLVAAGACLTAIAVQLAILPTAGIALAVAVLIAAIGAPALAVALDRRATARLAEGRRKVAAGVLGLLDAAPDLIAFGAHHRKRAELAALDANLANRARRQAFGAGAATALITLAMGAATVISTALATGITAPVLALVPLALAEALTLLPPAAQQREALRQAHSRVAELCHMWTIRRSERVKRATCGVALHAVDAGWPGAGEPTLRSATLYIPRGAHVAVVGPSGSGKSTLLALLLGFLDTERGTASVPGKVAWCPQEPQLISTTVRENLRVGDPTADDATLQEALNQAGIGHWAHRLDTKLDSEAISGGEAQRIALARALLAAPTADLVLLDEPTAHLDVFTAKKVLTGLRETLAGRTVVHVTHRPEEAAESDLVIEMA